MEKRTKKTTKHKGRPAGVRVEGLISRSCIRGWLENYEGIIGEDRKADVFVDSGRKSEDGVSGTMLNRIMLEAAIEDLPPVLKVCLEYRWISQLPLGITLKKTGIPKSTYYRRCDKAVDFIYYHVNGLAARLKDLVDRINADDSTNF